MIEQVKRRKRKIHRKMKESSRKTEVLGGTREEFREKIKYIKALEEVRKLDKEYVGFSDFTTSIQAITFLMCILLPM